MHSFKSSGVERSVTDRPTLLAPIVLNSPPKSRSKKNGIVKGPNPSPNLTALDPTLRRTSRNIKPSQLEEMEPPPVIPAAIQEQAYRPRPTSSTHSLRWEDAGPESGFLTPPRRGSAGTDSTTGWAENSPGGASSIAGPSNSGKQRRRMGGFFRAGSDQQSTVSADGGDEMDFDGTATPGSRRSVNFAGVRPSGEYSAGEDMETSINPKRPGFFRRYFGGNGNHGRSLSGWTVDSVGDKDRTDGDIYTPGTPYSPGVDGILDEGVESEGLPPRRRSYSPAPHGGTVSAPATPRLSGARRRATSDNIIEGESSGGGRRVFSRRASFKHRISRRTSREGERPSLAGYTKDTAARWKAIKAGIKMVGTRRAKEKVDQEKSAELVAELSAGTPAALIFASMYQRDEHGHRRIPVLLEQLKVRITESDQHRRHQTLFKVELEYGSGLTRMKWTVWRDFRDFVNLHSRYRVSGLAGSAKGIHKLPKFPRETIPYFKGVRGLDEDDLERAIGAGDISNTEGPEINSANPGHPTPTPRRRRPFIRRMSSTAPDIHEDIVTAGVAAGLGAAAATGGGTTVQNVINKHQGYALKQRQQLEDYLRRLIRMMVFRADSNRLCKFLELSALGVRLAAEGTYHGKEGYLIIRSSKGSDFRRPWNPSTVAKRHTPKWFLVRHSYIVCVDSPEEMNIYDVFLVDSNFFVDSAKFLKKTPKEMSVTSNPARPQHHSLIIKNHERTLKLLAKNERQLHQFQISIETMKEQTIWAKQQRFGSFAPVRTGVFAQWLVDGRDYFWNVSRAISMAKDVIYIHDWWLSPELYLRRPAAVSQKWRLDRLLQRKAQEGVKIFVIVYRNIGAAIPIDSAYTKYSLLDLHPNVYVQRSPNQFRERTFFWAHHEKILIVDHMIAFVGGIDLCFGRWDTPQHAICDNKPSGFEDGSTNFDPENFQLWPGKDYSNPRVQDFYNLDKPYEDMYDREKVPRMPWHDIHMQIVGQPARDLTRHFVQRWNYLLRQRTPSRPTPLLLPQPDFVDGELESLGVDGTCEVQILRSATSWSMGTPSHTESSIQNAYLKSIEMSEHLVYIENQFFITSTDLEDTIVENKIGDALVERITRAYNNNEDWRAIIIIPLMPGFQNAIDAQDGTSVRLIMHCQFRSISQGESSIFGRLKSQGIEPEDYIQFFSLRNWGKIGVDQKLVTEQLYIHAKCMIVDDRIAIIGSANINERSMLGTRDSEVAAIVRDTDAIESTMAGEPYKVGRFPHTLRVRLMREHLGLDVDAIMQEERMEEAQKAEDEWEVHIKTWQDEGARAIVNSSERNELPEYIIKRGQMDSEVIERLEKLRSFNHDVDWEQENNPNLKARKKGTQDPRVTGNEQHRDDVRGFGTDHMILRESERASLSTERGPMSPINPAESGKHKALENKLTQLDEFIHPPGCTADKYAQRFRGSSKAEDTITTEIPLPPPPGTQRINSVELGLPQLSQLPPLPNSSDIDIGGPKGEKGSDAPHAGPFASMSAEFQAPNVAPDMFQDPLNDSFYLDVWYQIAKNNTEIYRQVFRCQPDNEVKTWKTFREFVEYGERFEEAQSRRAMLCADKSGNHGPEKSSVIGCNDGGSPVTSSDGNEKTDKPLPINIRLDVPGEQLAEKPDSERFNISTRPRSTSNVSQRPNTATTGNSVNTSHPSGSRGSQESEKDTKLLQSTMGSVHYAPNAIHAVNCNGNGSTRRRRKGTTRSSRTATGTVMDLDLAEKLLGMMQGHLVVWPHDWLVKEQETGNWLYNIDQLAPIEI